MPKSSQPPSSSTRTTKWSGTPRRVLVLDDEALILRAVTRALRTAGLEVIGTSSPKEAIDLVSSEKPDAIVSDLHMPDGCGAAFLSEAADASPKTPRVLLSADPDFRPRKGNLKDARLFALLAKMEMARLPKLLVEFFECCRLAEQPDADAVEIAMRFARATARPGHEDDNHHERLVRSAGRIASLLGVSTSEADAVRLGAILHDSGQIAVPEQVFARPGSLGAVDRTLLWEHPNVGARALEMMPALAPSVPVVLGHHERWDGTGYPNGVAGTDVPLAARLFHVADCYDAMRAGRAYRKKRTHEDASKEILAEAGRELDPEVVRAFASIPEADLRTPAFQ